MRFDMRKFASFKKGDKIDHGHLIRASTEGDANLYITNAATGETSFCMRGTSFRVDLPPGKYVLEFQGAGGIIETPLSTLFESNGVPYTNTEKRPGVSSAEAAVIAQTRQFMITEARARKEQRRLAYEQQKRRVEAGKQTAIDPDLEKAVKAEKDAEEAAKKAAAADEAKASKKS